MFGSEIGIGFVSVGEVCRKLWVGLGLFFLVLYS